MIDVRPETRKCMACNMIHPAPWDNHCPSSKKNKDEAVEILKFTTSLSEALERCENYKEMIDLIKALMNTKGKRKG